MVAPGRYDLLRHWMHYTLSVAHVGNWYLIFTRKHEKVPFKDCFILAFSDRKLPQILFRWMTTWKDTSVISNDMGWNNIQKGDLSVTMMEINMVMRPIVKIHIFPRGQ